MGRTPRSSRLFGEMLKGSEGCSVSPFSHLKAPSPSIEIYAFFKACLASRERLAQWLARGSPDE